MFPHREGVSDRRIVSEGRNALFHRCAGNRVSRSYSAREIIRLSSSRSVFLDCFFVFRRNMRSRARRFSAPVLRLSRISPHWEWFCLHNISPPLRSFQSERIAFSIISRYFKKPFSSGKGKGAKLLHVHLAARRRTLHRGGYCFREDPPFKRRAEAFGESE